MILKTLFLILVLVWLVMVIMFLVKKDDSNHYRREVQDYNLYIELRNTLFQGIVALGVVLYLMKNNYLSHGKK